MGVFLQVEQELRSVPEADVLVAAVADRAAVTEQEQDAYVFRIAPLRNVTLTHPYFHDGSAATLKEAVSIMGESQLGQSFTREEQAKLVAFLKSLTGEFPQVPHPYLPREAPTTPASLGSE